MSGNAIKYMFAGIGICRLLAGAMGFEVYKAVGTQRYVTFTVSKEDRIYNQDSSKYLIFTNKDIFEDTDSLFNEKFNSSDVYNQLDSGKTYTCDVNGWRIPFFSAYPNILHCQSS